MFLIVVYDHLGTLWSGIKEPRQVPGFIYAPVRAIHERIKFTDVHLDDGIRKQLEIGWLAQESRSLL
jgi:hypothetical protein